MGIQISIAILFTVLSIYIIKKFMPKENNSNIKNFVIIGFISAFLLKIVLAVTLEGFGTDITLFKAWGDLCNRVGFDTVYYQNDLYLDYPPAYLYVLAFIDNIKRLFNLDYYNPIYTLLIKTPAIIADMLCGVFVYLISKKKFGQIKALILAMFFILNPLTIIDSSVWGQMDSICALFLCASLYFLSKDKFAISGLIYGIGFLLKPQMLIFAPVYLIYTLVFKKYLGLLWGTLTASLSILIIALPFSRNFDYSFLIDCYKSTIGYYDYFTINAYNFWGFIGKNWGALPENPITRAILSFGAPVIATILTGVYVFIKKEKTSIFAAAAVIMSTVYMFTVSMHERYLFPAMLMILIAYIYNRDKRFLYAFVSFSTISFLNVAYILHLNNTFISSQAFEIIFLSGLNLVTYFYFMYIVFSKKQQKDKIVNSKNLIKKENKPISIKQEKVIDRKLYLKDYIIVISVTIFYAFFAFWNLGVTTTANTLWTANSTDSTTLKVDGSYDTIIYLSGVSKTYDDRPIVDCKFIIENSDDGVNFNQVAKIEDFSVYTWKEISISSTNNKYVRITSLDGTNILNEIALRDSNSRTLKNLELISGNNSIIDEQDIVPLYPDYRHSTYFDEIYHARTAYEHLLGVEPYENTHPPLGKLIMSACISILGMNPFGWRFAGALFGVLMLPVLYHILKRLFGSTFLSTCGTLLFAFDFMHFTQTRIATIDTYSVFFILLMYDAMLIFMQKDISTSKLSSLLLPLGLSGLFMGLGVASKWTCAYGAIGLAVLFFAKLFTSYKNSTDKKITLNKCFNLCIYCIGFFVVIPFIIYFLSFLPILLIPHNANNILGNFISYQTHMFNYHSGLVAEHYFASPWYEWPLSIRNIWYFVTNNYNGSGMISTISCLGNPVLWWSSLGALIYVLYKFIKTRSQSLGFILVGFLSVYLPWVLVPRLTFVYHYFTAVPFIIIALMYVFSVVINNENIKTFKVFKLQFNLVHVALSGFVLINFLLFILFYPAISGTPTSNEFIKSLTLMPNWYLG